jgi:hypothetical protein
MDLDRWPALSVPAAMPESPAKSPSGRQTGGGLVERIRTTALYSQ